jgi:hypothetical protein
VSFSLEPQQRRKKMKKKAETKNVKIVVNRDCPVRMSMNCVPSAKNNIVSRFRKLQIPAIISAKNFNPTSQAMLIDLVVRASQGMLTVREITREVMNHSAFSTCFNYNIEDSSEMFNRVLGRVRRHNNNDYAHRTIKRNASL